MINSVILASGFKEEDDENFYEKYISNVLSLDTSCNF